MEIQSKVSDKLVFDYWVGKLTDANLNEVAQTTSKREIKKLEATIPQPEIDQIKSLSKGNEIGEYMIYLSVYSFLISKYFGRDLLRVVTPDFCRFSQATGQDKLLFQQILPKHNNLLKDFIKEVAKEVNESLNYNEFDYPKLISLMIDQGVEKEALLQFGFTFDGINVDTQPFAEVALAMEIKKSEESLYTVEVTDSASLLPAGALEGFLKNFVHTISNLKDNLDIPLGKIDYLNPTEKSKLLTEFNTSIDGKSGDNTLVSLFQQSVNKSPGKTAVVANTQSLNFQQLDEISNQLAHHLRHELEVSNNIPVGIMLERSEYTIIAMLAVLKAGGTYVPIDYQLPEERITYIQKESGMSAMIIHSESLMQIQEFEGRLFAMDIELDMLGTPTTELPFINKPDDLAYIIYTSGSTGKPKGVMIRHEAVVNYLRWFITDHNISAEDRTLIFSSIAFDLGYTSLWSSLLAGSTMYLYKETSILEPHEFVKSLLDNQITYVKLTPSHFKLIVNYPEFEKVASQLKLRLIVIGGEEIQTDDIQNYLKANANTKFLNHYGPTETTIGVVTKSIDKDNFESYKKCPVIGKPIANHNIHILDVNGSMLPSGVSGEICVSGKGLAKGYLKAEDLTKQKFGHFNEHIPYRVYRTGDLGRWTPEGEIEFLGRKDDQVKVRGYRIETGEVESTLLKHEKIQEVAVIPQKNKVNEWELVAYLNIHDDINIHDIKSFLNRHLPEYMTPARFIHTGNFPLTSHGKVDKKKLLSDVQQKELATGVEYVAAQKPNEIELQKVLEEVLDKKNIGIHDDFFSLGGDSIKAVQVASRMHKAGFKLEVKDIFEHLTIEKIASALKLIEREIDQSSVAGSFSLTPIQKAFFEEYPTEQQHHFNMSMMFAFSERLEVPQVQYMFAALLEHHDVLRTTINTSTQPIEAVIHNTDYPLNIHEYDLGDEESPEELHRLSNELQSSLDLGKGPLIKLGLFHGTQEDKLLVVVHHTIIDGVSWRILMEDMETLFHQYQKNQLPELPLKTDSFKNWTEKLHEYANSDNFLSEKELWADLEQIDIPAIHTDYESEHDIVGDSTSESFQLSGELTQLLLSKVNMAYSTGINDILLSAFTMAMKDSFNHDKVLISLESHGRQEIIDDLVINRTVGWFTVKYPVILNSGINSNIAQHIKGVKEDLAQIPNNGIGYGVLKYLTDEGHKEQLKFNLNPEINFNYLGQFDSDLKNVTFKMVPSNHGYQTSLKAPRPFKLSISGLIHSGQLNIFIEYNKRHYDTETIEILLGNYQNALKKIIQHCSDKSTRTLTPSDLTYKKLSIEQLDKLCAQYPVEDIYPLSPLQEAMLFQSVYDTNSTAYFYQTPFKYEGQLSIDLVEKSLKELFARHDILRTTFLYEGFERPLQLVLSEVNIDFHFEDIRTVSDKSQYIDDFLKADAQRRFDVTTDTLMRLAVLQLNESEYQFVLSRHHILTDAWSFKQLMSEYFDIHRKLRFGEQIDLPKPPAFKKFIQWLETKDDSQSTDFWKDYLAGYSRLSSFTKFNQNMAGVLPFELHTYNFDLGREVTAQLEALCKDNYITLNTAIQSLWGILLMNHTDTRDVVFGSVVSGRQVDIDDVEEMIGLFINTIPTRVKAEDNESLIDWLQKVQTQTIDTNEHQHAPLTEIASQTPLNKDLLDHIFIFENVPGHEHGDIDEHTDSTSQHHNDQDTVGHTDYDLKVIVMPGKNLRFSLGYNSNVYSNELLQHIGKSMKKLTQTMVADTQIHISDLIKSVQPFEEESPVRDKADVTDTEGYMYFEEQWIEKSISARFEEQATRYGSKTAIVSPNGQLTYSSLNKSANVICNVIHDTIQRASDRNIALLLTDATEMLPCLLGVLKSGNVYVPLDTEYPQHRLEYILQDASSDLIITNSEFHSLALDLQKKSGQNLLVINIDDIDYAQHSNTNPDIQVQPEQIAYILYTSGSTGLPKGVIQSHRYVTHLTYSFTNSLKISCEDKITLFPSFNFSASIMDIFGALLNGASLYQWQFLSNGFTGLNKWLTENEISIFHSVPSLFRHFVKELEGNNLFSDIRMIYLAGEPLTRGDFELFRSRFSSGTIFTNGLGCTEFNICRQMFMDRNTELYSALVPVGYPAIGVDIVLLDDKGNTIDTPGVGEIGVKSKFLALGYWNQPDLTKDKFITLDESTGERIYKTGDLGQRYADGCLVHLGRKDFQVKIRGQRVEPVEIELALEQISEVTQAIVIGHQDEFNEMKLVACMVTDCNISVSAIREELFHTLPNYMIPGDYVFIDEMPKTPSGKIDRKALIELSLNNVPLDREESEEINEIEKQLIEIWEESLGKDNIGVNDNFFQLGGHSIKAIMIKSKIEKAFDIQMNLRDFFLNPTVRDIAIEIEAMQWVKSPTPNNESGDTNSFLI